MKSRPTHKPHRRPQPKKVVPHLSYKNKYDLYELSVVDAAPDIDQALKIYRDLNSRPTQSLQLREDFCGSFTHASEFVRRGPKFKSLAIDLDPAPLEYGRKERLTRLTPEQQKRIKILNQNVLKPTASKSDIILALNFSTWIFKERELMKKYYQSVFKSLKPGGVFISDQMGGEGLTEKSEDKHSMKTPKGEPPLWYYWEQKGFNVINHQAKFAIHFKLGRQNKFKNAFTYDWRIWQLPELRDIAREVGFKKTYIYWEGTARDGSGSGYFHRREKEDSCYVWIAYLVCQK